MTLAYGVKLAGIASVASLTAANPRCLFRCEAVSYSYTIDPECEWYGSTDPVLEIFAFRIVRETRFGVTIDAWSGARQRWIDLRPGAKQWASPTVNDAVQQFEDRRKRQIYILQRQLKRAEQELSLAEKYLRPPAPVENYPS